MRTFIMPAFGEGPYSKSIELAIGKNKHKHRLANNKSPIQGEDDKWVWRWSSVLVLVCAVGLSGQGTWFLIRKAKQAHWFKERTFFSGCKFFYFCRCLNNSLYCVFCLLLQVGLLSTLVDFGPQEEFWLWLFRKWLKASWKLTFHHPIQGTAWRRWGVFSQRTNPWRGPTDMNKCKWTILILLIINNIIIHPVSIYSLYWLPVMTPRSV